MSPKPASTRTPWQRFARRARVPLGFVVAAIFLVFATPTPKSLLFGLILLLPGLWLRGYAAGYIKKNAELTRTGPYAHTRNPLYLGSMGIAFGIALASWNIYLGAFLVIMFLAIYLPTIRSEEAYLRGVFPSFDAYAAKVPRLLPRLTPARFDGEDTGAAHFSRAQYLHHREYNALIGAAAIYAALIVRWKLHWHV
ncbi:MAG: isoprenylcysteine carboxylmethyltransferase family protein [Bryocella sp.]